MQLIVNGLLIAYDQIGSGNKTILFLHGWADSGKTFEKLTKQFDGKYRIISLDLPGFGGSDAPKDAWTLDDFAVFVSNFIKKLNIDVHAIVAHSNGGPIAIRGLSESKFKAKKLVLIASAGIRNPGSLKNKTLKVLAKPAKFALRISPKSTQQKVKKKLYSAIGSDYMVVENMKDTFKNIVSADVLHDAKNIEIPVCLIYGENDESTPLTYGRQFEKAFAVGKLSIIKNAGHFVHQEQDNEVSNIIKDFLK
jgi:pimeloyl-ACP methyl ester carboxylesterase